jgi:hypothetical protein
MRIAQLLSGTALASTLVVALWSTTSAATIQIDESVEGQSPTVTSDAPDFSLGSITPVSNPDGLEEWNITFSVAASSENIVGANVGGLYEPGTNQTQLSDLLTIIPGSISLGEGSFTLDLVSDTDTHDLPTVDCTTPNAICVTENGDFQDLLQVQTDFSGLITIDLKSDLESVPEPGPLPLLAGGLGALALLRYRRNRNADLGVSSSR